MTDAERIRSEFFQAVQLGPLGEISGFGWSPITNAPRTNADGSWIRVLLFEPPNNVFVGFWMPDKQCWGTASGGWGDPRYEEDRPTHWMPIPKVPSP